MLRKQKHWVKWIIRILSVTLLLFLLIILAGYWYLQSNKQQILKEVTAQLNHNLNGEVRIGSGDISTFSSFPFFSVTLYDASITDTAIARHGRHFLKARRIVVRLSLTRLLFRTIELNKLSIYDAKIHLYTDSNGFSNASVFQKGAGHQPKKQHTAASIRNIYCSNVTFMIEDQRKNKLHDIAINQLTVHIKDAVTRYVMDVEADMVIRSLTFNTAKGSYAKGQSFTGEYTLMLQKNPSVLIADQVKVSIGKHPFTINARFDFTGNHFTLDIQTKQIDYAFTKTLVTPRIARSLSHVSLSKPVDIHTVLDGTLTKGIPKVTAQMTTVNNHMEAPLIALDSIGFSGTFTNEVEPGKPRLDNNSAIVLKKISGAWGFLRFTSDELMIYKLDSPLVRASLNCQTELALLNRLIQNDQFDFVAGKAGLTLFINGTFSDLLNQNTQVNGNITISNGEINYVPKNIVLTECNGDVSIQDQEVKVTNLRTTVLGNTFTMNGTAKNMMSLVDKQSSKANVYWDIQTPMLNLGTMIPLFQKPGAARRRQQRKGKALFFHKIENLLDLGNLRLTIGARQMQYKRFAGENVQANLLFTDGTWTVQKASLRHGSGKMSITATMEQRPHGYDVRSTLNTERVNIRQFFYAFDDFGQDGISYKHMEGHLSANARLQFTMNEQLVLKKSTEKGDFRFVVHKPVLLNFPPLLKIKEHVLKERDMQRIEFADITGSLTLSNQMVNISRMEVNSTIFSLILEGVYGFAGGTNISIQVPLKSLQKHEAITQPKNLGANRKGGTSVFLRAKSGEDGKVKIGYDVLGRFRKKGGGR